MQVIAAQTIKYTTLTNNTAGCTMDAGLLHLVWAGVLRAIVAIVR